LLCNVLPVHAVAVARGLTSSESGLGMHGTSDDGTLLWLVDNSTIVAQK